jgi:anaerobic magnesium-protoporphyrin IX monomethyl ester cyclase
MKVLLINPNNLLDRILGSGKIFAKPSLPFGLLSIAAYLRSQGVQADFRDSYLHNDSVEDAVHQVRDARPNVLGISCLTSNAGYVYALGRQIKKSFPEIKVVLGNHHASAFADFFLRQGVADVIVHGEGEHAMLELCRAWEAGIGLDEIKGISWLKNCEPATTTPRKFIKNLDELPMPFLKDLDYQAYPQLSCKLPYMAVSSSRGCVNKCKFCAVSDGRKFRARSTESVITEMKFYADQFGVKRFGFLDPLFIADRNRVLEFCDRIEQELPGVRWACEGHVRFISKDLAKRMADAGCESVAFGIESGNQAVLDSIGKNTRLDEIRQAVVETAKYVPVIGMFIIGLPGETAQTIEETIRFALRLPLRQAQFSMFCPYPGTELYSRLVDEEKISSDERRPEELVSSWERYSSYAIFAEDAPDPIYLPDELDLDTLKRLHKSALLRFYCRPSFIVKHFIPSIIKRQGHLASINLKDVPDIVKSALRLLPGLNRTRT